MGSIMKGILAAVLCSSGSAFLAPSQRQFHGVCGKAASCFHPSGWPLACPMKVNDEPTILEIVSILEGKPAVIVRGETTYDVLPGSWPPMKHAFDQRIRVYTKKPNNIVTKLQNVYSSTSSAVGEWLHRCQVSIIRTDDIRTKRGMYPRVDIATDLNLLNLFLALFYILMIYGAKWSISLVHSGWHLVGWCMFGIIFCSIPGIWLFLPLETFFSLRSVSIIMPNYNSIVTRPARDDPCFAYTASNWYCTMEKVGTSTRSEAVLPCITYVLVDEVSEELIRQKHKEDLANFDKNLNIDRTTSTTNCLSE